MQALPDGPRNDPQDPKKIQGESQPLMMRHISMSRQESLSIDKWSILHSLLHSRILYLLLILAIATYFVASHGKQQPVIPIEHAIEQTIHIGNGMSIWFQTWGSPIHTVPAVLFVHGGPGQAVVDYKNGNKRFFDADKLFVVEVDQRGTGNSQPSLRDDYRNMKYYRDVSIDLIAQDFEKVREHLGIKEWVVWGGSYGSTVALNYCMRYPESCTALLLRGVYLDTQEELGQVYSQQAFEDDERKLEEFNTLYDYAKEYVDQRDSGSDNNLTMLGPNDYENLLRVYEKMIGDGDRDAIWHWHAFENNLMEDRPENQLDPNVIKEDEMPEATSLGFFEVRLWLRGAFEHPSNLLERVDNLRNIPIWMCQGVYDNVCPVQNAWNLVRALKRVHHRHPSSDDPGYLQAYFLDANHEDTDPVMEDCLKKIINEFLDMDYSK